MKKPISFRAIRPQDKSFLYRVFVGTRPDITNSNLAQQEKDQMMRMQFDAQHYHYQTHFGDADFLIVLAAKVPVGRLYIHRRQDEIRIIDISLLPEHRRSGIGTQLMSGILKEAQRADKPIRLNVEHFHKARRFYDGLGFVKISETDTHALMEWAPRRDLVLPGSDDL